MKSAVGRISRAYGGFTKTVLGLRLAGSHFPFMHIQHPQAEIAGPDHGLDLRVSDIDGRHEDIAEGVGGFGVGATGHGHDQLQGMEAAMRGSPGRMATRWTVLGGVIWLPPR